jgi:Phosphoglucomutase/phosphomannomutase, alpha/beta/alpha domain I
VNDLDRFRVPPGTRVRLKKIDAAFENHCASHEAAAEIEHHQQRGRVDGSDRRRKGRNEQPEGKEQAMSVHPLAGKPAPPETLVDVAKLERAYYETQPDFSDPNQRVLFGTSGHRGTALNGTFTEAHILAITQAVCDYRQSHGIDGPVLMGKDTHALSGPAQRTALEVLAGNGVEAVA